jgi:hypothetical protein
LRRTRKVRVCDHGDVILIDLCDHCGKTQVSVLFALFVSLLAGLYGSILLKFLQP